MTARMGILLAALWLVLGCTQAPEKQGQAAPVASAAAEEAKPRLTPDGKPWPVAPDGTPFPAGPDGAPFPAQPDGTPFPALADGTPVPAGSDGRPLPVGPDGKPQPEKQLTPQEKAALAAENARLQQEREKKAVKKFVNFGLAEPKTAGVISGREITVSVGFKTDLTRLTPVFTFEGKAVSAGGAPLASAAKPLDFSAPVVFTITAEDGSTADYTVRALRQTNPKKLLAFAVKEAPDNKAVINEAEHSVALKVPFGLSLKAVTPVFTTTADGAEADGRALTSGVTKADFSKPVKLSVIDDEGKRLDWTVKIENIAANQDTTLTKLNIGGLPLEPAFNPEVKGYTVRLPAKLTSITFTATPGWDKAKIEVIVNDGQLKPLPVGKASAPFPIREGDNQFFIKVTAEDVKLNAWYIIVAKRQ